MQLYHHPVPILKCQSLEKAPLKKRKTANKETEPSRLLSLPAELRNRIYEYTLIDSSPIELTATLTQPPLLLTNRQIRHEATPIYYFLNTFTTTITSCNATLLCAFHTHIARKFSRHNEFAKMSVTNNIDEHTPNWGNLMVWCRKVFEGKGYGPKPGRGCEGNVAVVAAACDVAFQMRRGGCGRWENCVVALGSLRFLAGSVDERWLLD